MNTRVYSYIIACLCLFSLTSCLKDSECHFSYQLKIKINAVPGTVDSVSLYVFNSDDKLKEKISVAVDTSAIDVHIPLNHLPDGKYTYVVWGNLSDAQTVSEAVSGQLTLDEACVCLNKNENGTHRSPDDLYYGKIVAARDHTVAKEDEVTISRSVSGVIIKAYNLMGFYNTTDTDFALVVKGSLEEIPFIHNLTNGSNDIPCSGAMPLYYAKSNWKQNNELLESKLIFIFPSAEATPLVVNVYYKRELVGSYEVNSLAIANKVIEITLNFWNKDPEQWFNVLDWSSIEQEENM